MTLLPAKLQKKAKRSTRWRSTAHLNFVRGHACSVCGSTTAIEVAHVRLGSGTGMGQKPDDWATVSLCHECHVRQHSFGEVTFWRDYAAMPPGELIDAFCYASPRRREIEEARRG